MTRVVSKMTRDMFKTLRDSTLKVKQELLRKKVILNDIASELIENFNENGVSIAYFRVNEMDNYIYLFKDNESEERESIMICSSNHFCIFTLTFIGISKSDKNLMESIKEYCSYNALIVEEIEICQ